MIQNPPASARDVRDVGWIPELERSSGGEQPTPVFLPREFHVRNPNQALHLEKTHETPPSLRDEGLLFLHGLESNPESSLQTPQEA